MLEFFEEVIDIPVAALSLAAFATTLATTGELRPEVGSEGIKAKSPSKWPLTGPRSLLLIGIHACGLINLSLSIIRKCLISPIEHVVRRENRKNKEKAMLTR